MTQNPANLQVDDFILREIESVPHLEALLLLFNSRPRQWSGEELARALYIPKESAQEIVEDLKQRGLLKEESGAYSYNTDSIHNGLIQQVDRTYRRELLRVSKMIHAKAPSSVREFARAFRFKKD